MASSVTYKGQDVVLLVTAADPTGESFQFKDHAGAEINAANKGFFWKVNSISLTPTQNTQERQHVGTSEIETIATTKNIELSMDMDWYSAAAAVVLTDGGAATYEAVDPKSMLKQILEGDGDCYDFQLKVGCDLLAGAVVNGTATETYADPTTADFTVNLNEVQVLSGPIGASAGDISSTSWNFKVKSATIS